MQIWLCYFSTAALGYSPAERQTISTSCSEKKEIWLMSFVGGTMFHYISPSPLRSVFKSRPLVVIGRPGVCTDMIGFGLGRVAKVLQRIGTLFSIFQPCAQYFLVDLDWIKLYSNRHHFVQMNRKKLE